MGRSEGREREWRRPSNGRWEDERRVDLTQDCVQCDAAAVNRQLLSPVLQ